MRRECLDHIVIFNERHLRRVLSSYVDYYQRTRTHLSLDKDCPDPRPIMPRPIGKLIAIPQVGGLHHRYDASPPDSFRIPPHQCLRSGQPERHRLRSMDRRVFEISIRISRLRFGSQRVLISASIRYRFSQPIVVRIRWKFQ
jgi:hypothetical protein